MVRKAGFYPAGFPLEIVWKASRRKVELVGNVQGYLLNLFAVFPLFQLEVFLFVGLANFEDNGRRMDERGGDIREQATDIESFFKLRIG